MESNKKTVPPPLRSQSGNSFRNLQLEICNNTNEDKGDQLREMEVVLPQPWTLNASMNVLGVGEPNCYRNRKVVSSWITKPSGVINDRCVPRILRKLRKTNWDWEYERHRKEKVVKKAVVVVKGQGKIKFAERVGGLFYRTFPKEKKNDIPQIIDRLWNNLPEVKEEKDIQQALRQNTKEQKFKFVNQITRNAIDGIEINSGKLLRQVNNVTCKCCRVAFKPDVPTGKSESETTIGDTKTPAATDLDIQNSDTSKLTKPKVPRIYTNAHRPKAMANYIHKVKINSSQNLIVSQQKLNSQKWNRPVVEPPSNSFTPSAKSFSLENFEKENPIEPPSTTGEGQVRQLCLIGQNSKSAIRSPWYSEEFYTSSERAWFDIYEQPNGPLSEYNDADTGLLDYCLFDKLSRQADSRIVPNISVSEIAHNAFGADEELQNIFLDC